MKYRFARPKVIIKITGSGLVKVLNRIKTAGINVKDVCLCGEFVRITIDYDEIELIECIIENNLCTYEIEKKIGIYFFLKKINNLYSYILGAIFFGIILYIVSLYLWNIEYVGNLSITDEQLEDYLKEQKISPGIFKSSIDCNALEAGIRNEFFDITWVCAEIKGTNLIVHVNENYNKEIAAEEEKPYDLVAKHNSIITSIITRKGVPAVKVGDIVKEGDILIQGTVDIYNEFEEKLFTNYVNADGDVYGKTEFYYKDEFPLAYQERVRDSEEINKNYIQIFGRTIGGRVKDNGNYYIIDENRSLKIFGNFYIPIRIGAKKQYIYKNIDKKYSKEEATNVANHKLGLFLQSLEEKEMQILQKNVKIYVDQTKCKAEGSITVLEQLTKVSPINYQEEGTTIVNECN